MLTEVAAFESGCCDLEPRFTLQPNSVGASCIEAARSGIVMRGIIGPPRWTKLNVHLSLIIVPEVLDTSVVPSGGTRDNSK